MDKKILIEQITNLVFGKEEETVEAVELKFEKEFKTQEGDVILAIAEDDLAEGILLQKKLDDGTFEAVPETSFILEDGSTVSTDADSLIVSIEVAEEEAEATEEVVEAEMKAENSMDERIEKIESMLAQITEKFSAVEKGVNDMTEKVKEISEAPADEEIKVAKAGFSKIERSAEDRIEALAKFRK